MAFLELKNISKAYGPTEVLKDINLEIEKGEFVAVVGFSGSGKTTLVSIMAGLVTPDGGEVQLDGRDIMGPGPDRGVVFQSYSLMPWMTVERNVALAVDAVFPRWTRRERAAHVAKYVEMVGLSHAAGRQPAELSGGMRQRVAVARALAMDPEVLLLDEPLSALDALTRAKLQDEIESIWRQQKKTVVLVTNDVDEAILLADRVIPLKPGPGATLGTSFRVDMPRPRDRAASNHDPRFQRVRADLTAYLIELGVKRVDVDEKLTLPNVLPVTVGERPPKSYRKMSETPHADRYVEFSRLGKTYPTPKGPLPVVENFDLRLRRGEFVTLIGHSGCGKSTVLSMAAGLNDVTTGGIILDGKEVTSAGPDRGVVFQAPSLFPWLTVRDNVALGVDRVFPHVDATEREAIVRYYVSRVGLAHALDQTASDLSNGMKQRVGIARAFALSPKLLLLDEPFGMLDSLTRWELQELLLEVWARAKLTAICVTHDVDEAILLADRVVMMTNGPNARIGNIMEVDIPRPRTRKALLAHPRYYQYREELLNFLVEHERAAAPNPARRAAA
jgi:nitrate/nitrite transport system ATP-binding protein